MKMKLDTVKHLDHFKSSSKLYVVADVTTTHIIIMLVADYAEGEERKYRHYLHVDFQMLLDDKKLEKCVPVIGR